MKKLILISLLFTLFSACKKDPCDGVSCGLGYCSDGDCICTATHYEGTRCEVRKITKFAGTYNAPGDNCTFAHTVTVTETGITSARIKDLFEIGTTVDANLVSYFLEIYSQLLVVPDGQYVVSGIGTLSGTTLTIQYNLVFVHSTNSANNFSDACTTVCYK